MRRVVLLISVVVLAATTWILLRPPRREAPKRPDEPTQEEQVVSGAAPTDAPFPTSTIVGRVTHRGIPVSARVEVFHHRQEFEAPRPPIVTLRTADDGTFEVPGIGTGRYQVIATTEDGERGSRRTRLDVPGVRHAVTVRVQAGNLALRGRARWADGRPFAGYLSVWGTAPVRAAPDGRFSFSGLAPGKVSISALVPGRMEVWSSDLMLPREEEYEFVVDAGVSTLTGRVLALPDRAPVPGARLKATSRADSHYFMSTAETGGDGHFAVDVRDGEVELEMTAAGMCD